MSRQESQPQTVVKKLFYLPIHSTIKDFEAIQQQLTQLISKVNSTSQIDTLLRTIDGEILQNKEMIAHNPQGEKKEFHLCSARLNVKDRVFFTTNTVVHNEKTYFIFFIFSVMHDHKYENHILMRCSNVRNRLAQDILNCNPVIFEEETQEVSQLSLGDQKTFILDNEQRRILVTQSFQKESILLLGSAGTGKTLCAIEWLRDKIALHDEKVMTHYLSQSSKLVAVAQSEIQKKIFLNEEVDESVCRARTVSQMIEAIIAVDPDNESIPSIQNKTQIDFKIFSEQWHSTEILKSHQRQQSKSTKTQTKKGNDAPLSPEKIKQSITMEYDANQLFSEFVNVIIAYPIHSHYHHDHERDHAWLSLQEYLSVPETQSYIPQKDREKVYGLFQQYLAWLDTTAYYEPAIYFHSLIRFIKQKRIETNETDQLDEILLDGPVVIDEVAQLHYWELRFLLGLIKNPMNSPLFLCGDPHQKVGGAQQLHFLTKLTHAAKIQGLAFKIEHLKTNHRCDPAIVHSAGRLLNLENKWWGSEDRETAYTTFAPQSEYNPNEVAAVRIVTDVDSIKEWAKNTANMIILMPDRLYQANATAALTEWHGNVLPISSCGGLEWENVVLYGFSSSDDMTILSEWLKKEAQMPTSVSYARKKHGEEKPPTSALELLHSIYLAMTRARCSFTFYCEKGKIPFFIANLYKEAVISSQELTKKSTPIDWLRQAETYNKNNEKCEYDQNIIHILWSIPQVWRNEADRNHARIEILKEPVTTQDLIKKLITFFESDQGREYYTTSDDIRAKAILGSYFQSQKHTEQKEPARKIDKKTKTSTSETKKTTEKTKASETELSKSDILSATDEVKSIDEKFVLSTEIIRKARVYSDLIKKKPELFSKMDRNTIIVFFIAKCIAESGPEETLYHAFNRIHPIEKHQYDKLKEYEKLNQFCKIVNFKPNKEMMNTIIITWYEREPHLLLSNTKLHPQALTYLTNLENAPEQESIKQLPYWLTLFTLTQICSLSNQFLIAKICQFFSKNLKNEKSVINFFSILSSDERISFFSKFCHLHEKTFGFKKIISTLIENSDENLLIGFFLSEEKLIKSILPFIEIKKSIFEIIHYRNNEQELKTLIRIAEKDFSLFEKVFSHLIKLDDNHPIFNFIFHTKTKFLTDLITYSEKNILLKGKILYALTKRETHANGLIETMLSHSEETLSELLTIAESNLSLLNTLIDIIEKDKENSILEILFKRKPNNIQKLISLTEKQVETGLNSKLNKVLLNTLKKNDQSLFLKVADLAHSNFLLSKHLFTYVTSLIDPGGFKCTILHIVVNKSPTSTLKIVELAGSSPVFLNMLVDTLKIEDLLDKSLMKLMAQFSNSALLKLIELSETNLELLNKIFDTLGMFNNAKITNLEIIIKSSPEILSKLVDLAQSQPKLIEKMKNALTAINYNQVTFIHFLCDYHPLSLAKIVTFLGSNLELLNAIAFCLPIKNRLGYSGLEKIAMHASDVVVKLVKLAKSSPMLSKHILFLFYSNSMKMHVLKTLVCCAPSVIVSLIALCASSNNSILDEDQKKEYPPFNLLFLKTDSEMTVLEEMIFSPESPNNEHIDDLKELAASLLTEAEMIDLKSKIQLAQEKHHHQQGKNEQSATTGVSAFFQNSERRSLESEEKEPLLGTPNPKSA